MKKTTKKRSKTAGTKKVAPKAKSSKAATARSGTRKNAAKAKIRSKRRLAPKSKAIVKPKKAVPTVMTWKALLSKERSKGGNQRNEGDLRSEFQADFDRIIFSPALRRLQNKTQVHPLPDIDHVHNRLTHSLEVASVGRSLGTSVATALIKKDSSWPEDITAQDVGAMMQAACLAHDIGNPPFGHAGEEAIRSWFSDSNNKHFLEGLTKPQELDLRGYEGNAQGFRLLTRLEGRRFRGGLQLTYGTLGTFVKYPWSSDTPKGKANRKFGYFHTETRTFKSLAQKIGLVIDQKNTEQYYKHPFARLVEAADDMCYGLIDVEDAWEMKLLSFKAVESLLKDIIGPDSDDSHSATGKRGQRRRISDLRGQAMQAMIQDVTDAFIKHKDKILRGTLDIDLIQCCSEKTKNGIAKAKRYAEERIWKDRRKIELEIGAYSVMDTLLEAFCSAVRENKAQNLKEQSFKTKRIFDLLGNNAPRKSANLYVSYMRILDYICGMTDRYAVSMARKMSGGDI